MRQHRLVVFKPVEPARADESEAPRRPRPKARYGDLTGEGRDDFTLLVRAAVVDRLSELCRRRAPMEAGGILGGFMGRDGRGPFTVIEVVEEVESASASGVHVSWTGMAINRARARLAEGSDNLIACGWWHSHQHMDAFYSHEDRLEQSTWKDARNVGIVVGRGGMKLVVFHGPEACPVRLVTVRSPAFVEVVSEPVVHRTDAVFSGVEEPVACIPASALDRPQEPADAPSKVPETTAPVVNTVEPVGPRALTVPELLKQLMTSRVALLEILNGMNKEEIAAALEPEWTTGSRRKSNDPIRAFRDVLRSSSAFSKRLATLHEAWRSAPGATEPAGARSPEN